MTKSETSVELPEIEDSERAHIDSDEQAPSQNKARIVGHTGTLRLARRRVGTRAGDEREALALVDGVESNRSVEVSLRE